MELEDAIYHIKNDNNRVFRNGEMEVYSDAKTIKVRNIVTGDIGTTINLRYLNDGWKEVRCNNN